MKLKYKKTWQYGIKSLVIAGILGTGCMMSSCSDGDKAPDSDSQQPAPAAAEAEPETVVLPAPEPEIEPAPVVRSSSSPAVSNSINTMIALTEEADSAMTELVTVLKGINNKRSADAAVPRLTNAYNRLNTASAKLEKMNLSMSEMINCPDDEMDKLDRIGTRMEANSEILMKQALRIGLNDCYGSAKLEKFFDDME